MNRSLTFILDCYKSVLLILALTVLEMPAFCSNGYDSFQANLQHPTKNKKHKPVTIKERLQIFYPLNDSAEYSVTLCGDVPVNNNPVRIYKKGETGHVFIILSKKISTGEVVSSSFGFYPRIPVTFLIKQVRSKILDNSNREYDVSIGKKVTPDEFTMVLEKCVVLAEKKYNLKKYNCYDYALEVFNALPGIEKLPVTHVKFPFIFGKGGSPCGLYKDLKMLLTTNSSLTAFISFGEFRSPRNNSKYAYASY